MWFKHSRTKIILTVFSFAILCDGREPFKPRFGAFPFLAYFPSRHRGLCIGTLVSRTAVITAAVCVTNVVSPIKDTRSINVVVGASYRHPRRGIRVQATKVIIPNLQNVTSSYRGYLMQKSPAILILRRKIPDILTEIPMRPIKIDYKAQKKLTLQEECLVPGWHFFYKGDKIYPVHKFLLQRNLRVQYMNIVKKTEWCEALTIKFQKALNNLGFYGYFDKSSCICVRDPDRTAQPCHGMYGAPLICDGEAVAMMVAPDAQWANCTGFSVLMHLFSSTYLKDFMSCVSSLFVAQNAMDWRKFQESLYEDIDETAYDYIPEMYDKIYGESSSEE